MNGDQFNQFLASMTALPDKPQGLKLTDFKDIVNPLVPQEQRSNPKFAPDAEISLLWMHSSAVFPAFIFS
ncbi:hypothetical protein COEREDRAFT_12292 [Coemansia reversa NRRL 1564]|uniref:Uncharacterized protein n=1 Tax=Coemansia reversa (strain ATCC 12441 / NRRL 1564) TaxID=763665 RepID=A0A2G5B130_COERN|nr:hypothetical protein COEREDRAFT_12292 [Coemansia reversa NRRL 1564]|eukprot:PIA12725.1 hypothetical protein COEREDRAFT_12292 [Coemansia reversa NRRL 1564]